MRSLTARLAMLAALILASSASALPAPTLEEVRNATYRGLEGDSAVTLKDGRWEGAPFVEGSAIRPHVILVRDYRLPGDLDGDGDDEAVVLLAQGLGGSGEFMYLAVLDRAADGIRNAATASLGDQVQVREARIERGRLVIDAIQVGEPDARCCPGDWVTRTFTLGPAGLTEAPTKTKPKRLSPEALGGGEWVLRSWDLDEPLTDSVEVTLMLDGAVIAGDAGCNRYAVPYKNGDLPGDIRLGPVSGTLMACPDPGGAVEKRYLDLLGRARKFSFMATNLLITWEKGGSYGTMIFERRGK